MKKILESMAFGKFVMVDEQATSNKSMNIPGFYTTKASHQLHSNTLLANNGEKFTAKHVRFTCGNNISVVCCNEQNNEQSATILLGDKFPNQKLVIATTYDRLQFFAPVCNSKAELADFLVTVEKLFQGKQSSYPWHMQDSFVELALWLYVNNPNKKSEPDWGIWLLDIFTSDAKRARGFLLGSLQKNIKLSHS